MQAYTPHRDAYAVYYVCHHDPGNPGEAQARPGLRFGLIDNALAPLEDTLGTAQPAVLAQLKRDLAVVVSAEALFSLTDLHGLAPEDAIASIVHTATTLTRAALGPAA